MVKVKFTKVDSKEKPFIKEFTTMNELLEYTENIDVPMNIEYVGTEEEKLDFLQTLKVENNENI